MKVYPIKNNNTKKKLELYLQGTSNRNYVIYSIGTQTGLRIGDIINLKIDDIKGNFLNVVEQKTKKTKNIKLTSKLKSILNNYIKGLKGSYLFPSRQNTKMSVRRVQQIFKELATKLNLEQNFNTHSLRKTYAYDIYTKSNNNLELTMLALNHSSQAMTIKYLGIDMDLIFNLMEDINAN
ncbi:MAG: tyrosine-type recombinase/integrase [Peptostreptococcaceae bacterium]